MRWVGVVAAAATLAGCTIGPSQMTWMRRDGTPVDAGFHFIATQCREIAAKVGKASPPSQRQELMNAAMHGCMAQHGYHWRCAHPVASFYDGSCLKFEPIPPAPGPMPPAPEPQRRRQ